MKKYFTLFCFFTLFFGLANGQITTFNFLGLDNVPTANSTFNDPNIVSPVVMTRGTGASASPGGNSFRTQGFQNDGVAAANTDYFEFSVTAKTGFSLNPTGIDATFRGTATFANSPGVTHNFAYSIGGGAFTFVNTDVTTIGASDIASASFPFSAATITALSGLPAGTVITFRYFASGQTTTGGWGFYSSAAGSDNLVLNGNVTGVLPISISTLNASKLSAKATQLNWEMDCSASAVTYEIQHSNNGISFNTIFSENVTKQRCELPFSYVDNSALNGANFYRIKSYDIDGNIKYSQVAKVQLAGTAAFEVYPTISKSIININFNSELKGKVSITVIDVSGRIVRSMQGSSNIGTNRFTLDISDLAKGQYYVYLIENNIKSPTQRIIKM